MNNLPVRANESPFYDFASESQTTSYQTQNKIISTLALLVLGYYVLSFFDAWPSTIKRSICEFIVYITPSPLIYAMQYGMIRLGHLDPEEAKFKPANFGDMLAKQEAIRKIFGQPHLPLALRKVRSLSGPLMSLGTEIGPPGLGNWDNSCYQNSTLQGLASLPAFYEYMECSEKLCDRYDIPAVTHRALVGFLEQLADSSCRTNVIWTPRVLKSMDSWQQQDAQEYFSRVLDAVEKEASQYARRMRRSATAGLECLGTFQKLDAITTSDEEEQSSRQLGIPTIGDDASSNLPKYELRNPIEGMTAQCLQCTTCGFTEGLSLTQFTCLTLNLGLKGGSNVECLLDEYTAPEEIEGVECDNCTKLARGEAEAANSADNKAEESGEEPKERKRPVLRTKAKQITIGRLPKDLVLHINRSIFNNYGNQLKNTAPVQFPARLNFLSRWCAPLDEDGDTVEAVYELKCVVTHYGSHHDGHYIALGKRNKDWFSFNDERVTKIPEEEVLSRGNGFMLFYEAVPLSPPSPALPEAAVEAVTVVTNSKGETQEISDHLHQNELSDSDARIERVFDDEMPDSGSDFAPSSEMSEHTTPASSESSSPTKAPPEVPEKQNDMIFPVMKTASDVSTHVQDQHARGAPIVPVL